MCTTTNRRRPTMDHTHRVAHTTLRTCRWCSQTPTCYHARKRLQYNPRRRKQLQRADSGGRFPHDQLPSSHTAQRQPAAKLASTRDTHAQTRRRIDTKSDQAHGTNSLRQRSLATPGSDQAGGATSNPTLRPQTRRRHTTSVGDDGTTARRKRALTRKRCPMGNRSNLPQLRYPIQLTHTGRPRKLSQCPRRRSPATAHESQRSRCEESPTQTPQRCAMPTPTLRRDRTGRTVCGAERQDSSRANRLLGLLAPLSSNCPELRLPRALRR